MNRFWTALGVPAITIPFWRSDTGLPIGLQLVGRLGSDHRLMGVAQSITDRMGPNRLGL